MKKIIVILCMAFVILIWAEELPKIEYDKLQVGTDQTLEVMTWNIQNFPKSEFSIDYAAKIINAIDVPVLYEYPLLKLVE